MNLRLWHDKALFCNIFHSHCCLFKSFMLKKLIYFGGLKDEFWFKGGYLEIYLFLPPLRTLISSAFQAEVEKSGIRSLNFTYPTLKQWRTTFFVSRHTLWVGHNQSRTRNTARGTFPKKKFDTLVCHGTPRGHHCFKILRFKYLDFFF